MAYLPVHKSRSVRDERGSGENEGKLLTGQSFLPLLSLPVPVTLCYWAFWYISFFLHFFCISFVSFDVFFSVFLRVFFFVFFSVLFGVWLVSHVGFVIPRVFEPGLNLHKKEIHQKLGELGIFVGKR